MCLTVTVTDSANRLVAGLEQEDFQVFEDQVQQDITIFSRQPQPIALSLVIDTSASMENKLPIAQEAAMGFVRRMGPEDKIQIIDFDSQSKILQTFSGDRAALEHAIKRTEAGGSTSLYNAMYTAISDLKRIGAGDGSGKPPLCRGAALRRRRHVQHRAATTTCSISPSGPAWWCMRSACAKN